MFARRRDRKDAHRAEVAAQVAAWEAEQQENRRVEEAGWLVRQANALTLEPDCQASFVAKRGEVGYFSLPAQLVEPRTTTYRAYASKRVNVGGYKFRVGGSAPIQQTAMTPIDSGTMLVTSDRVLFVGTKATREWLFSKIVGYDDSGGATLFINVSNRQKTSGIQYDPKWDAVVEGYFLSAVTKATDPDSWADQIEQALAPVASRLHELGYGVSVLRTHEDDSAALPPPVAPGAS
jgi:hypothetical protein